MFRMWYRRKWKRRENNVKSWKENYWPGDSRLTKHSSTAGLQSNLSYNIPPQPEHKIRRLLTNPADDTKLGSPVDRAGDGNRGRKWSLQDQHRHAETAQELLPALLSPCHTSTDRASKSQDECPSFPAATRDPTRCTDLTASALIYTQSREPGTPRLLQVLPFPARDKTRCVNICLVL